MTVLDPNSEQSDTKLIYAFVDPNNPATYLPAEQAEQTKAAPSRSMPPYHYIKQKKPFTPLDIVNRQNGLLSMMIGRNESLPAPFQYQTPWVTYTEIISPTLDTAVPIDVAGIGQSNGQAAPRSIVDHLTALFTALMTVAGNPKPLTSSFQAIMYFAYPPSPRPAPKPWRWSMPMGAAAADRDRYPGLHRRHGENHHRLAHRQWPVGCATASTLAAQPAALRSVAVLRRIAGCLADSASAEPVHTVQRYRLSAQAITAK